MQHQQGRTPTTNRQRRMQKSVARLKELQCQMQTFNRRETEGKEILEVELVQMLQLWRNTTKDAVEEEPYAPWLDEGKWELTRLPTSEKVDKLLQMAKKRAEETDKEAEKERKKESGKGKNE